MATPCDPPDDSPEQYREYVRTLLRMQADPRLNGKIDLSGVIQQTLLEAHAVADQWKGWTAAQRAAWLRAAAANNYRDEVRKFATDARDVSRERSIEQALDESSGRMAAWLAAEQSTPSQHVARDEDLKRLADALATLPEDQRRAIELHHLQGLPLTETAAAMGKTTQSVVGLCYRGLLRVKELLNPD